MGIRTNLSQRALKSPASRFGFRLALTAILSSALLLTAFPAATTEAATVGNCQNARSYPGASTGEIRWSGMAECFSMFLEHGFIYTITVDAGPSSYRYSRNINDPLGDSVLTLYRSKLPGIGIEDPYNDTIFEQVAMNDDYALPAHLGSRVTYDVTGTPYMSTLFVARVAGYGTTVGTYSITVNRSAVADLDACEHVYDYW